MGITFNKAMANGFTEFSGHLEYQEIDPDSTLMRPVSEAIIRIQSNEASEEDWQLLRDNNIILAEWEAQRGPCQSKPIISYIQDKSDGIVIAGSNGTNNFREFCIRHVLQNDVNNLYSDCEVVCAQPAHAEIMALINYLLWKGILVYEDIEQLFPKTNSYDKISFGKIRHEYFLSLINTKGINIGDDVDVSLYGQELSCDKCAKIMIAIGIKNVKIASKTHSDVKKRRDDKHALISPNDIAIMESTTSVREG